MSSSQPKQEKNQLKIFNSLTRDKEIFNANQAKVIKWYTCGPTVYDVAHLGHARCYITFDIIRRILANYFGYEVFYVMNITDIDDKIIKRARSNHLCDQYKKQTIQKLIHENGHQDIIEYIKNAIEQYRSRRKDEEDKFKRDMIANVVTSSQAALEELGRYLSKISDLKNSGDNNPKNDSIDKRTKDFEEIFHKLNDIIADDQDTLLGHTITDHKIFESLTVHYEQEFHDDMKKLGVLPASALTRVSGFIPQIGAYIKRLEQNEFAYKAPSGSIYFDTNKFHNDPKHKYAKLVPEAFDSEASSQSKTYDEGEGELSSKTSQEKRSANDFVLWKKSKPGEPSWTCEDFVAGRPGWHIECSVMASHLLGDSIDIHSGGCDLKFPHHDNEIAQAEAYFNTGNNWINYFMHSGHLTIAGCKMSKSLKNFITIRKALENYTSRQLRYAFLAHGWTHTLDYSENTMNTAKIYERTFNEFFLNVADHVRRKLINPTKLIKEGDSNISLKLNNLNANWSPVDHELNKAFLEATGKVDSALCDNFDTRTALNSLSGLVKDYNKASDCDLFLLKVIASYIFRILEVFGAGFDEYNIEAMFNITELEMQAFRYVHAMANFRADIRVASKLGEPIGSLKQILNLCDSLRDTTLPNLGIRLVDEDVDGLPYVIQFVNPQTNQDLPVEVAKYVDAMAQFRADIIDASKLAEPKDSIKQILRVCDALRDVTLANLGVRLEDKEVDGLPYVIKFVDPETLAKERVEKEQARLMKEEAKRLAKLKLEQARENKLKKKQERAK